MKKNNYIFISTISNKYNVAVLGAYSKVKYLIDTNTQEKIFEVYFKSIEETRNNRTIFCIDSNNNFYYIDLKDRTILLQLQNSEFCRPDTWFGNSVNFNIPYLWLYDSKEIKRAIYDLRTKECVLQINMNTPYSYNSLYGDATNNFGDEEGLKEFKMKMFLERRLV